MSDRVVKETNLPFVSSGSRGLRVSAMLLLCLAGTSVGFGQSSGLNSFLDDLVDDDLMYDEDSAYPTQEPADLSYLEDKVKVNEYDIVDLHVNNEDLGNVLQLLSLQSQRNIIASNKVSATVTADLYNVTFEEALNAILHVNGYGWVQKGNFIYVYTAEELTAIEKASRRRISRVVTLDYLNAVDAATFVQPLLSAEGKITANSAAGPFNIGSNTPVGADEYASNAMIVLFDYEENVDQIVELIGLLDTKPVQVLVEATILQTSLNESNAFGVDFSIINNMNFTDFVGSGPLGVVDDLISGIGSTMSGGGATDVTVPVRGNGSAINTNIGAVRDPGGLKAGIIKEDVAVFLRLLDEVTDVTVISNPKILTLNRMPARVLVGTKVGYLQTTTTDTSTTQSVEFLDTGTQLNLRPFVSADGIIRMELKPQVSSFRLRNTTDSTGATITIPDEDTSELVTNVMVRDGQTVVLGGLFTESTTATRRQVPGLGDIPLIGAAFKGHDDTTRRSEIIFMITPSIVNDHMLNNQASRAGDHLKNARTGERVGTLPWSRDRRVSRLLIEARKDAESGDREGALFKVRRALTLYPQSLDARRMLDQLSTTDTWPSRSMLEDVIHNELQLPPASVNQGAVNFKSNSSMSSSNGSAQNAVTDWLLANDTPSSSTGSFGTTATKAEPNGFIDQRGREQAMRQSSPQDWPQYDAAWLPKHSDWYKQEADSTGHGAKTNRQNVVEPSTQTTSIFDQTDEFDSQSGSNFGSGESLNTSPSMIETTDQVPTQAQTQDYLNSWGDFGPITYGPEMIPVFIPMHGGLFWIAVPRGMFSAESIRSTFSEEAVTNAPTNASGFAD